MPETQEIIIISERLRKELASVVHETLERESSKLYVIQSELRASSKMKTRTAGWKREEEDARRRVELYTIFLAILQTGIFKTGKFTPTSMSNLPAFVLRDVKSGLLEMGLSFARTAYQRAVEAQAEIKSILWRV